jgi:uncharacterized membrane protein
MKKLISKVGVIALMVLFSSCATQKGYMLSSTHPGKNNFIVIKNNVHGIVKATSVFGLGRLSKGALINEAKAQLIESNHLTVNQSLVNLNISWKMVSARPFLITNRCTVTADIVEYRQNQSILSMVSPGY